MPKKLSQNSTEMNRIAHLDYYTEQGRWSETRSLVNEIDPIPADIEKVFQFVQGLLLHDHFGRLLYGDPPPCIETASRVTLPVSERLRSIHNFQVSPLTQPREVSFRSIGTCRDFALLACAILRHKGFACRVRCGFARYFNPPAYEDHWIIEIWNQTEQRWLRADPQIDKEHVRHLSISFSTTDLPAQHFLFPCEVWERHHRNLSKLSNYGHGEHRGLWFVRVNLARDLFALMKDEVTEWDTWRDHAQKDKAITVAAINECAELAMVTKRLSTARNIDFIALENLFNQLSVPHWRKQV